MTPASSSRAATRPRHRAGDLGLAQVRPVTHGAPIAGFSRHAVDEELLNHSPAAHVRRPRLGYESHATGLDRNERGAPLVAAGLGRAADHALISLLALNELRVPEATGADIQALGAERGHRILVITRKGGKVVTIGWHRGPRGRSTWSSASGQTARSSWLPTDGGWTGTVRGGRPIGRRRGAAVAGLPRHGCG